MTGPGPIGLLVLQVARTMGERVVISGREKGHKRFETAVHIGADHIITVDKSNLIDLVMDLTDGRGVVTAFEYSGAAAALNDCLLCVKRRGQVIQVGLFGGPVETVMDQVAVIKT